MANQLNWCPHFLLFFLITFFLKLIVSCTLCVICMREDNDSSIQLKITQLTWTLLSAVQEGPLNLITHSPPVLPHGITSHNELMMVLTQWGRVMHICVNKLTSIGSDNGLLPGWRLAITWTKAWILLIRTLGTIYSEILIKIHIFPFTKMHLKMLSGDGGHFVSIC